MRLDEGEEIAARQAEDFRRLEHDRRRHTRAAIEEADNAESGLRAEEIERHFPSIRRENGGAHPPALDAVKRVTRLTHVEDDLALAIAAHAAEGGERLHMGA